MSVFYSVLTAILLSFLPSNVPYSSIESGFESNDSEAIVSLCKEKVFINVLGDQAIYSKSQASLILKSFFAKNPCSKFEFIFKGKEISEGVSSIATFRSKKETFRVNLLLKKNNIKYKIESLIIEK